MPKKKKVEEIDIVGSFDKLSTESNIDVETYIKFLEDSLAHGYKNEYKDAYYKPSIVIEYDREKGYMKPFAVWRVVSDDTEDFEEDQITYEEAKKINPNLKEGDDRVYEAINPAEWKNVSIHKAKQTLIQSISKYVKELREKELANQLHKVVDAIITDVITDNRTGVVKVTDVYLRLEQNKNIPAVMHQMDLVEGEEYRVGDKIKVYLKAIRQLSSNANQTEVSASRSAAGLVKCLLESQIPEIPANIIEIKAIARDPGKRTKVAVALVDPSRVSLDPVSTCIGENSMKIRNVKEMLGNENIDIIPYSSNIVQFISASLAPAKVTGIEINEEKKKARVKVSKEMLSLAIGKRAENVRLAVKLTGWKLDIIEFKTELQIQQEEEARLKAELLALENSANETNEKAGEENA